MKRPIEPEDIRKGDLIRCESVDGTMFGSSAPLVASEFVATGPLAVPVAHVRYFLLDRPKPAVELPETLTLGWITVEDTDGKSPGPLLGKWERRGTLVVNRYGGAAGVESVTAFTPAVVVPADALDELRSLDFNNRYQLKSRDRYVEKVREFLAAVDEANGASDD